jgi:hypothetical protein
MNQRCVVPAHTGTSLGGATKWIPACAGMTPASGVMSTIGVVPAQAGTQRRCWLCTWLVSHWVPACARTTRAAT